MESSPISMLKVDFQCSRDCPRDVKKTLEQFNGVESISVDPKRGMVKVIGKVNPMTLVKLLQKTGQRAELWSFQKAPVHQAKSNSHTNDHRRNHNSRCCRHRDNDSSDSSDSSTDSDDRDCYHCYASENTKSPIYWQHPKMNAEKSKKKRSWKEWLGLGDTFVEPKLWIKSPRRPRNFPQPPPVCTYYNPMMSSYYMPTAPFLHARPPMPAAYAYGYGYSNGFPPSYDRSRHMPSMIHYTSYADNFRL